MMDNGISLVQLVLKEIDYMKSLPVKVDRADINKTLTIDYFEVDIQENMTVLNVLEEIYYKYDPTIAFRYSCRTGLCATCGMLINGKPGLSCMTIANPGRQGYLALAPLPKGNTIIDLVKEIK